jgi:hypothetical protein
MATEVNDVLNELEKTLTQTLTVSEKLAEQSAKPSPPAWTTAIEDSASLKVDDLETRLSVRQLETRVETNEMAVLETRLALKQLEQKFEEHIELRDSETARLEDLETLRQEVRTCKDLLAAYKDRAAWREDVLKLQAEQQELVPTLKQHVQTAVSEQVSVISEHINNIETVVTKITKAFGNRIETVESQCSHLHPAVQELRNLCDIEAQERSVTLGGLKEECTDIKIRSDAMVESCEEQVTSMTTQVEALRSSVAYLDEQGLGLGLACLRRDFEEMRASISALRGVTLASYFGEAKNKAENASSDDLIQDVALVKQVNMIGDLYDLRSSVDEYKERVSAVEQQTRIDFDELRDSVRKCIEAVAARAGDVSSEEGKAIKNLWTIAHTTLRDDMRELMASQLQELRKSLATEVQDRSQAIILLGEKLEKVRNPDTSPTVQPVASAAVAPAPSNSITNSRDTSPLQRSSFRMKVMNSSMPASHTLPKGGVQSQIQNQSQSLQPVRGSIPSGAGTPAAPPSGIRTPAAPSSGVAMPAPAWRSLGRVASVPSLARNPTTVTTTTTATKAQASASAISVSPPLGQIGSVTVAKGA